MVLLVECAIAIAVFTACVVPATARNPLGWIGDYPPAIRERCKELGLVASTERRFTGIELVRKTLGALAFTLVIARMLIRFNGDVSFWQGFRDAYILWLAVTWWDALVIDCGWFCHSSRVRIPGTEDMPEYRDYAFHLKQSCIGTALGVPACLLVGVLVQVL